MSELLIRFRSAFFMGYMLLSIALLVLLESTFNGGFALSMKWMFVPVGLSMFWFLHSNMGRIREVSGWSTKGISLFAILLFYPIFLLMTWPYFLAVNALLDDGAAIAVAGPVTDKFVTKGRYGEGHVIRVKDQESGETIPLNVTKGAFEQVEMGDHFEHRFFPGAFGIPWHFRGKQPLTSIGKGRSSAAPML